MPSYRTPSVSPAAPSMAPTSSAPANAAPTASEGTPEWMSSYNLSAGNAATLSLITGASTDEGTANGLLDGTADLDSAGPATAAPTTEAPTTEAPAADVSTEGAPKATVVPEATQSHKPAGDMGRVYAKHDKQTDAMKLTLTASQKNELAVFRANWDKNHARYETVAAQTGVPAKLIAAIHYREASMRWDTYLHQGDPLGRKAVHHPSNIPIFYKWEDAAVHALNMKKGLKDSMGMDETTTDKESIATYAESYNGLGYDYKGKASPYVYAGTDQYKGGRYVADGVYDARSVDQRVGVMALIGGLDGADLGSAPRAQGQSEADGWALVVEGKEFLSVGSSGAAVKALQQKLTAAGFKCAADGSYGAGTATAVRAFQQSKGQPADGKVGKVTAALLDGKQAPAAATEAPAAEATNPEWARVLAGGMSIFRGDEGEHVNMIQELLTKKGFPVTVDGDFGGKTERAVVAFQRANHMAADGIVGQKTARALQG